MRPFVRPALGTLGALALGAGGLGIGLRAAAPDAATLVEAAVVAPVAVGDAEPGTGISAAVGTAWVAEPGGVDATALPVDLAAAIDALDLSGGIDPALAWTALSPGDGGGAGADDPCASAGEAAEDCPTGLSGTVGQSTAPPVLEVWPQLDPPAVAEGSAVWCPDEGDGLTLGIGTTVPADVTVRYWPLLTPTDVRTVTAASDPADAEAWAAEVSSSGGYPRHRDLAQHCVALPGLATHTYYVLQATAIDVLGRTSDPVERTFSADADDTVPPLDAVPLTDRLLYVAAPNFGAGRPPLVRAWAVEPGASTSCADQGGEPLPPVQEPRLDDVSWQFLGAHHYKEAYDRARAAVFDVPEGSTMVVCARWYDIEDASWDDAPQAEASLAATSPDTWGPVLTLDRVDAEAPLPAGGMTIAASTVTGLECGSITFGADAAARGTPVGLEMCDPEMEARSWATPAGSGGDAVVSIDVGSGGDARTSRFLLPLGDYACAGACPEPPALSFVLPIPGPDGTSLGSATVGVAWEDGGRSGLDRWLVGSPASTSSAIPRLPDPPAFDDSSSVVAVPAGEGGSARATIVTDRHAVYVATIAGDCFLGDPPAPATGDTAARADGEAFAAVAEFDGLCAGHTYRVTAELVDDSGRRTVAGYRPDAGAVWWAGAQVTTGP